MSALLRIRAERDQMSAIERRVADFVLENAHLLRDYSSQQVADALGISQSSVVKFSQKFGFKGYPDLKYAIVQAAARGDGEAEPAGVAPDSDPLSTLADALWELKSQAEAATRLINPPEQIRAVARAIARAGKVYVIGLGEDGIPARAFATRLSMLGVLTVHYVDAALMQAGVSNVSDGDVLLVFSEHGRQPTLGQIARRVHERGGHVVTVTRNTSNPLRAHAELPLLVSAHDGRRHVEPLLYQSALLHVLDLIFVLLCESSDRHQNVLGQNLDHMHDLLDS